MTDQEISELSFEALDLAVGHIQKCLGVMSGDAASHFFNKDSQALRLLEEYIRFEINNRQ
jgi:hypothetical protein